MPRTAVVIGAGITGTLTGHSLRQAGWDVTILEARAIGAGSSSRTAAGIRQQFSTVETVLGMRYAVAFYKDFPARVGGVRAPIRQNGYLFLSRGPRAPIEARVRLQHGAGLTEVELLSADEAHARFAWLDPSAFEHATWCPTDGFLFPADVYNEAASALQRAGGTLLQQTPVTAARHENGRIAAVASGERWFPADLFVDATNAWSPRLAQILGGTELTISPLKRYLWFLERAGALSGRALESMPLVVTPGGAYCRPENEDSLLTGWAHDAPSEPAFTYEDQDRIDAAFFHKTGVDSKAYEAWMAIAHSIPPVGDFAGVTATTSGFYATTPDHNPFLGFDPKVPNLLRLVGFSGHGAMFGPFTALVGTRLAEAGRPLDDIDVLGGRASLAPFRLDRQFGAHESMVI
jgi:glycine/D-amino acid oxidase-like deaminating enzyme